MIKYINNFGDLKVVSKLFSFNGGKEQDLVFTNNNNKLNNNISQQNELLSNSDFNNISNLNNFDNGREKGRLNNQISKNKICKPLNHNDYMNQNIDYKSFKNFTFNK